MELLQNIKLFSIPTWMKLSIAALLGVLGVINTVIFFMGILNEHRDGWVKASVDLLSVVLPIFILALVVWKSEAGIESLRRKTEEFFLVLLPSVLERLVECDAPFFEVKERHELADLHSGVKILVNLQKNDCYSDIVIIAPDRSNYIEIVIRLELNVKKLILTCALTKNLCLNNILNYILKSPVHLPLIYQKLQSGFFAGLSIRWEVQLSKAESNTNTVRRNLLQEVISLTLAYYAG